MRGVPHWVSKQVLQSGPLVPLQALAQVSLAQELIPSTRLATDGSAAARQAHRQAGPELLVLQVPSQLSVAAQVAVPAGTPPPAVQSLAAVALK